MNAAVHAAMKTDKLLARGDVDGAAAWKRIVRAIEHIVEDITAAFIDLVENKGHWYHFWQNGDSRHERAAQLLSYAVAECYCKSNNLDVSPETNSGGGPVDFKFSSGYAAKVLVEVKLSTASVVHGYAKQLPAYMASAGTTCGKYLILDVGGMGGKLRTIEKLRNVRARAGAVAPRIFEADGKKKVSASKR